MFYREASLFLDVYGALYKLYKLRFIGTYINVPCPNNKSIIYFETRYFAMFKMHFFLHMVMAAFYATD